MGIYTRWTPKGWYVVLWSVISPLLTYFLKLSDAVGVWSQGRDIAKFNALERLWYHAWEKGSPWFGNYIIGYESLILNAGIVALGLGVIHFCQNYKRS